MVMEGRSGPGGLAHGCEEESIFTASPWQGGVVLFPLQRFGQLSE